MAVPRFHRVELVLSPQAMETVDELLKTGLFGFTRADALERMLMEYLRERYLELPKLRPRLRRRG